MLFSAIEHVLYGKSPIVALNLAIEEGRKIRGSWFRCENIERRNKMKLRR